MSICLQNIKPSKIFENGLKISFQRFAKKFKDNFIFVFHTTEWKN